MKTGQILCEMWLKYAELKIFKRIFKSKESMRTVRNKEGRGRGRYFLRSAFVIPTLNKQSFYS